MTGSKKNLQCLTTEEKRALIEKADKHISISRQCELLGLSRGACYYQPRPVSEKDLFLMRLIDKEYTRHPFYGSRRLSDWLRDQNQAVSREKVRRIMKLMGLEAIYPKKRLSLKNKEHRTYPYLLRGLRIDHPDHVWGQRYHLYQAKARFCLSCGGDGLVQPMCAGLGIIAFTGFKLLCEHSKKGSDSVKT